ncbi:MAG: sugar ABC transporter permease [Spirochaetales bacterium]|uniref:carbohydrate ABC transporter permease n=1 Tax=Bullifex sp. TaxID=2815808 RepID=UPI002A56741B|nr:sugar ABC transporter permease [Bullifex sp.]MDD7271627.1 sugar ABC transporter permease [Spirochaetales bacterium]MDY4067272.1 sugar ABC transporter permease [Bullifex sp.]
MRKKIVKPYLYILPALLLAIVFVYYPFIRSVISSFFNISIKGKLNSFCAIANYKDLFTDEVFYLSLKNTFIFMVMFVPLNTLFVITLVVLTRRKNRLSKVAETVFMLPMTIGLSSAALLFKFMFNETNGVINSLLHLDILWSSKALPARFSLVFLGIFLDISIDYLLLLSAYRNLDKSPIEASMVDGCTPFQVFLYIKLPLLLPTLSFIVFIAIKDALLICAPIMVMTEGGPARSTQTIVYYYYLSAFKNSAFSKAAAISTCVFIIAAIILTIYKRFEKMRITY